MVDLVTKKYIVLNVVKLIDRSTPEGNLAWREMTEHHLFKGNDTCMEFEKFYHNCANLEDMDEQYIETYGNRHFPFLIVKHLNENGYRYITEGEYLIDNSGNEFDGVLLDIMW